jgi:hypothetical protein
MPFITFIYKIGKNSRTYYGKYCEDRLSDDHEGLDNEVRHSVEMGVNAYRKKMNLSPLRAKITIGILSLSINDVIPIFSSKNEVKCFDFYKNYDNKIFMNGKSIIFAPYFQI